MPEQDWTIEVPARGRRFSLRLGELWQYRDLIMLLAWRDFVSVYKQTILGPFWFLLQPLVTTLIFTVVFGNIIGIPTGEVPKGLFYFSGVTIWTFFASCLTKNAELFVANAGIFKKVYFPRLAVPASSMIIHGLTFLVQFGLFLVFWGYYLLQGAPVRLAVATLLLPMVLLQVAVLGFSIGILISSLTIKYRDLSFLTGFAVQLWMYATPIIYPDNLVPERWQGLYALNPMVFAVKSFRQAFWDNGPLVLSEMVISLAVTAVIFLLAIMVFSRVERTFVDTI